MIDGRWIYRKVWGKSPPRRVRKIRRGHPVPNEPYRAFVRTKPCCCRCGRWPTEFCHSGPHFLGVKAQEKTGIPLFRKCHIQFDKNPRAFERARNFTAAQVAASLNAEWFELTGEEV